MRSMRLSGILAFMIIVHAVIVFAGFFAPQSYRDQDRLHPYAPPTRIHFQDSQGGWHLRPFVYGITASDSGSYAEQKEQRFPIRLFVTGDSYSLAGIRGTAHLFGVAPPGRIFLLGTDEFGRDQFSRLLYGGQVSLFAGLTAALLAGFTGLLLGGLAGFYGGWRDDLLMRAADIFVALPWFYLLIGVRAFLPLRMNPAAAFLLVIVVIGIVGWGRPARLIRGVALAARERNSVLAARGFGAPDAYLLRRHIFPAVLSVTLTQIAILAPQFVLAEVTLSFLGLGVGEPFPSWGNMLAAVQQLNVLESYWWMLLPGLAPLPVFLSYHFLADCLSLRLQSEQSNPN